MAHLKLYEQFSLNSIPPTTTGSTTEKRLVRMLDDSIMVFEYDGTKNNSWKPVGNVIDYVYQHDLDENGRVFFNGEVCFFLKLLL